MAFADLKYLQNFYLPIPHDMYYIQYSLRKVCYWYRIINRIFLLKALSLPV